MSYGKTHIISLSVLFLGLFLISSSSSKVQSFQIGLLKYNGGGDWYANPTALPNLVDFCNKNMFVMFLVIHYFHFPFFRKYFFVITIIFDFLKTVFSCCGKIKMICVMTSFHDKNIT